MKKPMYSIKLETTDNAKYLRAQELVKSIAKSEKAAETSNLDLCYFLDNEGKARIKFDRCYLPMSKRIIEITNFVDSKTVGDIVGLLYNRA